MTKCKMTLNYMHMGQSGPLVGLKQATGMTRFLSPEDLQQIHRKVKAWSKRDQVKRFLQYLGKS